MRPPLFVIGAALGFLARAACGGEPAPRDPGLRADLIREAFLIGDMEAHVLAYLTDRILSNEGSPQMYGTQGGGAYGSPEDERRIDANRKAIGLEPWSVYVERLKKSHATNRNRIASWE